MWLVAEGAACLANRLYGKNNVISKQSFRLLQKNKTGSGCCRAVGVTWWLMPFVLNRFGTNMQFVMELESNRDGMDSFQSCLKPYRIAELSCRSSRTCKARPVRKPVGTAESRRIGR